MKKTAQARLCHFFWPHQPRVPWPIVERPSPGRPPGPPGTTTVGAGSAVSHLNFILQRASPSSHCPLRPSCLSCFPSRLAPAFHGTAPAPFTTIAFPSCDAHDLSAYRSGTTIASCSCSFSLPFDGERRRRQTTDDGSATKTGNTGKTEEDWEGRASDHRAPTLVTVN